MPRQNEPKPRLHGLLWQAYLQWNDLVEIRKHHELRAQAAERGASNLDPHFERGWLAAWQFDKMINEARSELVKQGKDIGPIWDWLTSIRGLKEGRLAAELIAQIDDIKLFDTVSKLWRFAGFAVIEGKIERNQKGTKSTYNRRLKSACFVIAKEFVRMQTPVYADLYYEEKARQRRLHPTAICSECDTPWDACQNKAGHKACKQFGDGHIDNRAVRKVAKIFLQHLWVTWREIEHLPVSEPYVQAMLGHTHIVGTVPTKTV